MNRFQPREGTPAPYTAHMLYMADSVDQALRGVLADYLAISSDFFIEGAVITPTPVGASTQYAVTAGHLVYKGEVMPIDAHSIIKSASQVVYLQVQDDGVDGTPVLNLDGTSDFVMRRRHARLRVGAVYPDEYMAITAPRKEALDRQRLRGRMVPQGGILPYQGSLLHFDATGLGLNDSPMAGWAICNGLNGTPDLRGMVPVGATEVPATGAGALYTGVSGSIAPGARFGSDQVTLSPDQLPEHTHALDFPSEQYPAAAMAGSSQFQAGAGHPYVSFPTATAVNETAGEAVDVRQPSHGLVYVMSIA